MKATNIPATILRLMAIATTILCATACKVTVYRTAIEVTPSSEYVETGKAITATANKVTYIEHSDGSTEVVSSEDVTTACTWSVSNEAILKAGGNGTFTGATPGDATIKATYANASGDCDVKVTGTRTGIEVRNLETEMNTADWGKVNSVSVKPAGQLLTFNCNYSFEYRVTYTGGEPSEWFKVSSTEETEGPLTATELKSEYGMKAGGYMERLEDFEYAENFTMEANENPETGFCIDVPAHHYTEPHGCNACFGLSVAGDTALSKIKVLQCSDQYTMTYKDTAVSATFMMETTLAHDVWEWQDPKKFYDTITYTIRDFYKDTLIHMDVLEYGSFQGSEVTVESSLVRKKRKEWASKCYDEDWKNEYMKELSYSTNWQLETGSRVGSKSEITDTTMVHIYTLGWSSFYIYVVRHFLSEEEFFKSRQ